MSHVSQEPRVVSHPFSSFPITDVPGSTTTTEELTEEHTRFAGGASSERQLASGGGRIAPVLGDEGGGEGAGEPETTRLSPGGNEDLVSPPSRTPAFPARKPGV